MARRQFPDVLPHRFRPGHIAIGQVVPYGLPVQTARKEIRSEKRLDLGGEHQDRAVPVVIERLDAQSVPDQEEFLFAIIPGRHGEHSVPVVNGFRPLQGQALQDDLGIARGLKSQTGFFQTGANGFVVVDLSVVDDSESGSTVPHRLVTTGEIDDAESSHAEGEVVTDPGAFVIGSTMRDGIGHRLDRRCELLSAQTAATPAIPHICSVLLKSTCCR